ncbi:MAG TPA: ABC transporter permease [Blastocatellia bacterium]|nr:ABC transporter permease [Blastocatellia bacterium]
MKIPFWRQQRETELDDEINNHLRQSINDRVDRGEDPDQATASARREIGNVDLVRAVTRSMWGWIWLEQLAQDFRFGARTLLKNRSFSLIAVVTLALGIGANTAIFSVVNSVLLRPLPYPEPDRIVQIWETYLPKFPHIGASTPDYYEFKDHANSFSMVAGFRYVPTGLNLTDGGDPQRIKATYATSNLFSLLGVNPIVGRTFRPEEDQSGNEQVVMISHKLWQSRFGGDQNAVGKTIKLNGASYRIVGVLPAIDLVDWADVWMPLGLIGDELTSRRFHPISVIARLKPGVTIQQAQSELTSIEERLRQQYPRTSTGWGASVTSLQEDIVGKTRPMLLLLFGAVGFVLLIACTNVANLLLARAATRQKEVALRTALGASRLRVMRQLLAESLLLSLIGGTVGFLLAIKGIHLLVAAGPADLPRLNEIGIDGRVLGFAVGAVFLTGLICGILPALQASRTQLSEILKQGSKTSSIGFNRYTRGLLVVSEIALALVLLIGAGLLIRTFRHLLEIDPGFKPDHLLTMQISVANEDDVGDSTPNAKLFQRIADRVKALPGVVSAAGISYLPLDSTAPQQTRFLPEGEPLTDTSALPVAEYRIVSDDYFKTIGIPLLAGRTLDERDWSGTNIVINQTMAERYWPGQVAVGKRINQSPLSPTPFWITVVGVVGNTKQMGLDAKPTLDMYLTGGWTGTLVIRTDGDPLNLAAAVRQEIRSVDNQLPISEASTMNDLVAKSVASRRFSMMLLGIFAGVALLLSTVGIYGVIAYSVAQRTNEIGVRVALGAQRLDILKLVIGEGLILGLTGITIGIAAALGLTRLMQGLLFNVSATDPLTFTLIALLLGAVALLASYIPARKAMRVDPMLALRYE